MVKLDFSQALETPNQEYDYSFSVPISISGDVIAPNKVLGDASVIMKYFVDYDGVLHIKGNVRVPCLFICDRCGENFERNLFLEFDESFSPEDEDFDEISYNNAEIDIGELISEYCFINFPNKNLCREDCKGLCTSCGTNLNEEECQCSKEKVGKNNPFKDLFDSTKLGGKL